MSKLEPSHSEDCSGGTRVGVWRGVCLGIVAVVSLNAPALGAAEGPREFNVREHGAKGDGVTLDSAAINRAIDAAAEAGGGTVVVPEGRYLSGTICFRSRVTLRLDKGAVIVADQWDSRSYDPTEPFDPPAWQDGGHTFFHNSLMRGEDLTDIAITGEGMIDGSGLTTWRGNLNKKMGFREGRPAGADSVVEPTHAANKAVAFKSCKNVTIRDITILKGGWFAILVTGCDKVLLENLLIDTNRDGIDIDCCHDVTVRKCRVNSPADDAICPKSSHVLGYPRLTERLVIEDCQVSGFEVGTLLDGTRRRDPRDQRNGRIKFGTESSGGFRDCRVRNCVFLSCMGFALEEVDGGLVENIEVSGLRMSDVKNYVLYIVTGERNRTPDLRTVSRMRNVSVSDVVAEGVDTMSGIQVFGIRRQPIEGLRLRDIRIVGKGGGSAKDAARVPKDLGSQYPDPAGKGNMPAHGIFARHVKDLRLENMEFALLSPDLRPAARFEAIDGLVISNFAGQSSAGVPLAKFGDDVTNVTVERSPGIRVSQEKPIESNNS